MELTLPGDRRDGSLAQIALAAFLGTYLKLITLRQQVLLQPSIGEGCVIVPGMSGFFRVG